MQRKRSLGCAHRFRPTYAGANVGHPSITFEAVMTQTFRDRVQSSQADSNALGVVQFM